MVICMKTTLNLDDHLVITVKKIAAERGTTMTAVIEEALRIALVPKKPAGRPFKLKWHPVPGKIREGVDLDDRAALYDLMEDERWRGDRG
jgi:hypothetical protein